MGLFAKITTASDPRTARIAGILLMLLAMLAFSFSDAAGKTVVATYSVGQLLLLRALAGLFVLSPLIWRQRKAFLRLERPGVQLARMVIAACEVAVFYLAAAYLPLADVITFYLASSLFVSVGAALFLGETIDRARGIAIVVGFVGVLIALQPSAQTMSWPALIAILASVLFAGLLLLTRFLRQTPDMVLASQQFAGTLLLGLVLAPSDWITPSATDLVWFAISGAVSAVGLLCVNRSLRLAPARVVVPYQYTMIIFAAAFGWLLFGDVPSRATVAGVVIIISAGLYLGWRERSAPRPSEGG
ncbi:DMT family transporter [Rhodopseudomonas sp. BR0C11]|uniref:DMT family transporter n=1 Tax=Rhodopseudomonas sp. BR0C11 TaxID=2269370 RepID=UPI0013DF53F0|nr:DMT family transporter [Rhodopseudomonas sp. BR0C11]NEV79035.1 DMT family transporter [Rhodopseudomonas sp. BR0C11]